MVDPTHETLSLRRQCELLGLPRASFYSQAQPESPENIALMQRIDQQYTDDPCYGVRSMTAWLQRQGESVNEKRVRRLLRLMGLEAIYCKPRLSLAAPGHQLYPYLLRNVPIKRVNQVRSTASTYIRLVGGFVYLVAVIDWYARYILSWEISLTLESDFCRSALQHALVSAQPEIFNSDQGGQFTAQAFTGLLKDRGIAISMAGRGRAFDNIFIERFWRTLKYEDIYLKNYETTTQLMSGLGQFMERYNRVRLHQALDYQTPEAVYRLAA